MANGGLTSRWSRRGDVLRPGPHHNLLQLIVLPAIVEPPKFEFFPAVGPRSHGALDPAAIVNAVLEGVQAVNQKDATAYAVARIDYRPTTCRLRARIKCWLL